MTPTSTAGGGWKLGLLACLALLACGDGSSRRGDPSLEVDLQVSPTPASTTGTRVAVLVTDSGAPARTAMVALRAEGPGTTVEAGPLTSGAGGRFSSPPLTFPASGEWTLVLEVRTADGREATFRTPVFVSGPPPEGSGG